LNGHIGLNYYHFIAPKIALSAGLTYARLHQNLPTRTYQDVNYDFGKTAAATNITTQRLDYIELPVSVFYQLAPKHFVTSGVSLGYVLQSKDKVEDPATNKTTFETGYLNAINRWDAQLNIGYQYMFTRNLWVRATYHYGLMDISNNNLFNQTETNTNKGFRLTLGYKVF
jgi:hypothetical protein